MKFPKATIVRDKAYLKWVRQQPCVITGRMGEDIDPAHIRHGCFSAGMKPGDDCVMALSHNLHMIQHNWGEETFWLKHVTDNPDLLMRALKALARENYREYLEGK